MAKSTVTSSAPTSYLDLVAATDAGRSYKSYLLAALEIEPGNQVLDVGCGPGTDLAALAAATGPTGTVFGIDQDPQMAATAHTRMTDQSTVQICQADAHQLPFGLQSIDRALVDRVLMHVADPTAVLAEVHRVLRPGGLLALAEPDWDTLAIDHPDLAISRAFTRYIAERINRNPAMGRRLLRLVVDTGYSLITIRNTAAVLTDFESAETIFGLRRNTERAVNAGYLTTQDGPIWLEHLTTGTFFATLSFITVLAIRAVGGEGRNETGPLA